MLVDRIGQLGVLLLRAHAVVDDLAIGAVLVELGRTVLDARRLPEVARALRPSRRIFCCSNILTKNTYQDATDIKIRMIAGTDRNGTASTIDSTIPTSPKPPPSAPSAMIIFLSSNWLG
jgi:hypothetical protein